MRRLGLKIGFLSFICLIMTAVESHAFITMDIAEAAGRISSTFGDYIRRAEKELDKQEQKTFDDLIGHGNDETKLVLPTIKGWSTNYAKDKLKIGPNADVNNITEGLESRIKKLEGKIGELVAQKTQVGAEKAEKQKIKEEELQSKIDLAKSEIAEVERQISESAGDPELRMELENYAGELGEELGELEKELSALQTDYENQNREELKRIQEKLDFLNSSRDDLLKQLAEEVKKKIKSSVNLDDSSKALTNARDENYVKVEAAEQVKDIRIKRFTERRNAVTSTYADAVLNKLQLYGDPEVFKDFDEKSFNLNTLTGHVGMDTVMKIKIIELLMQYTDLMVNELRTDTASEYAILRFYKLREPENDLFKFNLDDYQFTCPSKSSGGAK